MQTAESGKIFELYRTLCDAGDQITALLAGLTGDDAEDDSMRELRAAVAELHEHVPRLVLIGMESSGKTSLLTRCAAFPVGFSAGGTATRCPVEYTFTRSADYKISVNGNPVDEHALVGVVQNHMQEIARTERISQAVLRVVVEGPHINNLRIIDLPGIKAQLPDEPEERTQERELIDQLVDQFVQDRAYHIVVVTPLDNLQADQTLYNLAQRIGDEWRRRTTVLITKFTRFFQDNAEPADLNRRIRDYREVLRCEHYFTEMYPSSPPAPNSFTAEQQRVISRMNESDFIRQNLAAVKDLLAALPELEMQWLHGQLQTLRDHYPANAQAVQSFSEYCLKHFGLKQLLPALAKKYESTLKSRISDIRNKVDQIAKMLRDRAAAIQYDITALDSIEDLCKEYLVHVVTHFKALLDGSTIENPHFGLCGELDDACKKFQIAGRFKYEPDHFGQTFAEDMCLSQRDWDKWYEKVNLNMSPEVLQAELHGHILGRHLPMKMIGLRAFERLCKLGLQFPVLSFKPDFLSDNDIHDFGRQAQYGRFDTARATLGIAKQMLTEAHPGVGVLCENLVLLYSRYIDCVRKVLTGGPRFRPLKSQPEFLAWVRDTMVACLHEIAAGEDRRWRDDLNVIADGMEESGPATQLMSFLCVPLEEQLVGEVHARPQEPPTADSGSAPVPPRHLDEATKHRVLRDLRAYLRDFAGRWSLADVVLGGVQQIPQGVYNEPDYDFMRKAAMEYYYSGIFSHVHFSYCRLKKAFGDDILQTPDIFELRKKFDERLKRDRHAFDSVNDQKGELEYQLIRLENCLEEVCTVRIVLDELENTGRRTARRPRRTRPASDDDDDDDDDDGDDDDSDHEHKED